VNKLMSEKISAIIIAGNEEDNIRECLESVTWCDEIVLVDSESKDRTVEIAKEFTDKIFIKSWEGYAKQKKYSLELARNEWVISIDADERVSEGLKKEIQELLKTNPQFDGYRIPRESYFLNKVIKSCFWYPDYQLRLFRKSKTHVIDRKVHEGFEVDGKIGTLKNDLIHYTHQNLSDTFAKINKYSTLEAEERVNSKIVKPFQIILHPVAAFLNHFISRKGYKDGVYGMMVSAIHAMTNMMTYMKMWEMQNKDKT